MKNKTVLTFLIMFAGAGLLGFLTPWWVIPFWIVMVAVFMMPDIKRAILCGSLSFVLAYTTMAIYMVTSDNHEIIKKTGLLLGGLSSSLMILSVVIISLITGTLSGWLGGAISLAFYRNRNRL